MKLLFIMLFAVNLYASDCEFKAIADNINECQEVKIYFFNSDGQKVKSLKYTKPEKSWLKDYFEDIGENPTWRGR